MQKAMAICAKSEKCLSDIEEKLHQWNVSEPEIGKILSELVEQKFIDENRFASFYVRDKFRFNQWGKIKISFMLKAKKIPHSTIDNALSGIDPEQYLETLKKLLKEKARNTKFVNEFDKKGKLTRFARGRGFEFDVINEALKSF